MKETIVVTAEEAGLLSPEHAEVSVSDDGHFVTVETDPYEGNNIFD